MVQLLILILAIDVRTTSNWMAVLIIAVAFGASLIPWLAQSRASRQRPALLRQFVSWPLVMLFVGLLFHSLYQSVSLHPIYFTDDEERLHQFWGAAIYGLAYYAAPDVVFETPAGKPKAYESDLGVMYAELVYLKKVHFFASDTDVSQIMSPWTHTLRFGFLQKIQRGLFIQGLLSHPWISLKVYAFSKPANITSMLFTMLTKISLALWLCLAVAVFLVSLVAFWSGLTAKSLTGLLGLASAVVVFSTLAAFWGWATSYVMADVVLAFLTFLQVAACLATVSLLQRFVRDA
jgi:hypothetical protein